MASFREFLGKNTIFNEHSVAKEYKDIWKRSLKGLKNSEFTKVALDDLKDMPKRRRHVRVWGR